MSTKAITTVIPYVFALGIGGPAAISVANTPLPDPDLSVINGAYQSAYEDQFSKEFPLSNFAQDAYVAFNLAAFGQAHVDVVVGADNWLFTQEEFQPPETQIEFMDTLSAVGNQLADHGITLIPVVVPDKARIYSDKLPRDRDQALMSRYTDIQNALIDGGFASVDLAQVLAKGRGNQPTFMRTDTHWSPFGAALSATHLATTVGLSAIGPNTFETTLTPDQPFNGDLMKFVDTGWFANWVGIVPEHIDHYETHATQDAGLGLFGDADVGIVLVGTSYSARSDFNFEPALKQATGLDVVNLAQEGKGPFDPMVQALESAAILDISPQFVVWEIPERYISPRNLK